jgi:hypothetical protein
MSSGMVDLAVNIAAGLLTAAAVWLLQWSLRRRRLNRTRDFFGLAPGTDCLLVVNRHATSANELSVHRRDVFALLELAGLIRMCGARTEVVGHDEVRRGFGEKAEFCIGGPTSNSRTAAHLEWKLPGVEISAGSGKAPTMRVGDRTYNRESGAEYVLLAKVTAPEQSRPVFLICGQTAVTNQAAARYLVAHERKLARKYGTRSGFCAVLKVINPAAYGPDVVEWVADVTAAAFRPQIVEPPTARAATPTSKAAPPIKVADPPPEAKPAAPPAKAPTGPATKAAPGKASSD